MANLEEIARRSLLQKDIHLQGEEFKQQLAELMAQLHRVEREFPALSEYLTDSVLVDCLRTGDVYKSLCSFMREDRVLLRKLETILSIDGVGRPEKARLLAQILQSTEAATVQQALACIGERRFL